MTEQEKSVVEWLREVGFDETIYTYLPIKSKEGHTYALWSLFARFANIQSWNYQAAILGYRQTLPEEQKDEYDKYFNIHTANEGEI